MTSFGPGGYPDGQRVANWDTGLQWNLGASSTGGPVDSPVMNMSRYARVGGAAVETQSSSLWTFRWYADPQATVLVGSRVFVLDHNIVNSMRLSLVNLGPYLKVTVTSVTGGNFAPGAAMFGTTRTHPLEIIPINPVLIDKQSTAIAASATANLYPSDYYAGPVNIGTFGSPGVVTTRLMVLTSAGVWDIAQQHQPSTAAIWETLTWITPPGAWRIDIVNGAAANSYFLTVVPSVTGST